MIKPPAERRVSLSDRNATVKYECKELFAKKRGMVHHLEAHEDSAWFILSSWLDLQTTAKGIPVLVLGNYRRFSLLIVDIDEGHHMYHRITVVISFRRTFLLQQHWLDLCCIVSSAVRHKHFLSGLLFAFGRCRYDGAFECPPLDSPAPHQWWH